MNTKIVLAVIMAAVPQVSAQNHQSQSGLIGHWKMDDIRSPGLVPDSTPNAWHATCKADSTAFCVPGKLGRVLRFPAAGIISLDRHAATLGKLTSFTVSMWIQYDGGPSRQLFTFSDGTTRHRMQMEVHEGKLHFGWQNGDGFAGFGTPVLEWKPSTWYHVVFVNDTKTGKSILRSNDLVWKTDPNTLAPAGLKSPIKRVTIGSLHGEYRFNGCVDDLRLYDRALSLAEQLALEDEIKGPPTNPAVAAARKTFILQQQLRQMNTKILEQFTTAEAPHLSRSEFQVKADWLFQLEDDDPLTRAVKEIGWTGKMIARLMNRRHSPNLTAESVQLKTLEKKARDCATMDDVVQHLALYFDVRALKRRLMLSSPDFNFSRIICVDAPYPHRSPTTHGTFHQNEWVHESRFRSEMCASHGAKLLILDDVAGTPVPRSMAPPADFGQNVALLSFDLSFDGKSAVFCMKPEQEKAHHLYEIGLDGKGFRQITTGGYSDIDPIYLPGKRFLFLSTRAEVYAQCGMWARSHILSRCDADGKNIYILSPASEPEYSPSLMEDGRILYTRWEYVDKFANRIQSLWTMRPDGTAATTFWGNQSVYPDHLGEGRQISGSERVIFSGFGHHDVWAGCIGIVDPRQGLNYPLGIWKVTQDRPWPEVGDGPVPTPGMTADYHTSGKYAAYKTPYPLGEDLFLVSARTGGLGNGFMYSAHDPLLGKFKLYLMDIFGNRELLFAGDHNVLYAQPVRPRKCPPQLPDIADMPGSEKNAPVIRPGVLFSSNIFSGAPAVVQAQGKYLRVVESMPKNYSSGIVSSGGKPFGTEGPNTAWGAWGERFLPGKTPTPTTDVSWGDSAIFSGPATSLTGPLGIRQELGTVPIRKDGSICIQVPPCKMLYFQVLDEHYRAMHTMRSWVSLRPGEYRGCVGCHELRNHTQSDQPVRTERVPDLLQRPAWGVRSLSFVKDIQPIFERACSECHAGGGQAVKTLDLTLRRDERGGQRWGGIFPEPYLTLLMGKDHWRSGGACPGFDGKKGYLAVPNTIVTSYDTLPPLTYLSPRSRLIDQAMDRARCGKHLALDDLRMLICWIDLWAMFRSDEEMRAIEDPPAEWFPLWSYPPKTRSAPRVRIEYSQDEYRRPQDRLAQDKGG